MIQTLKIRVRSYESHFFKVCDSTRTNKCRLREDLSNQELENLEECQGRIELTRLR